MTVCGAVRAFRNLPASALTKIAQIASPPSTYQLAMTKGEVANWLGITPATLSRCLKQLVTEGKTSVRGRQITIHHGAL